MRRAAEMAQQVVNVWRNRAISEAFGCWGDAAAAVPAEVSDECESKAFSFEIYH